MKNLLRALAKLEHVHAAFFFSEKVEDCCQDVRIIILAFPFALQRNRANETLFKFVVSFCMFAAHSTQPLLLILYMHNALASVLN